MKVEFKPKNPLTPNVKKYLEMFGHLPSIEAAKFLQPQEIDEIAKEAIAKGEPVKDWEDRPNRVTGTILDALYK